MVKKTRAELEAELVFVKRFDRSQAMALVICQFIKWGGLAVIGYFTYLTLAAFAGKYTTANVLVNVLGNLKISQTGASLFGLGGVGYGAAERKLRKNTEKRLGDHITRLEKVIDPNRTSSR